MRIIRAQTDSAAVELSAFEVTVLLYAVTSLGDLEGERMDFLPPARQPEVDALYGDLSRLLHETMAGRPAE